MAEQSTKGRAIFRNFRIVICTVGMQRGGFGIGFQMIAARLQDILAAHSFAMSHHAP